ncbi:hypothetical protein IC762_21125 [Bradyrhizobium genosp. L]|uniref:hypothetical protein n=1 Tax=Bradyrhizobium genosp. L TaxID=83637 RepID=UPI0018A24914|nr:hypothetical protein [Bradyrhizobium genosp. L]QPF82270.1 hypothetical protein IC762_21125 [Bradyrhizobium genosp. L]
MPVSRRQFISSSCAAAAFSPTFWRPASARMSFEDRFLSIMQLAERLQLLEPRSARAAGNHRTTDLATVVLNGLEAGTSTPEIRSLVRQAGSLLSALNRASREVKALSEGRRAYDFQILKGDYRDKFKNCALRPEHKSEIDGACSFILSPRAKRRYADVADDRKNVRKVPWYLIAAIHFREASSNFLGHLHNGDRLDRLTTDVPRGRPKQRPWPPSPWDPVAAWKISALDALPDLPVVTSWTVEQTLWGFERYNGMGCRDRGIPSPYLWSYSQYYQAGGYSSDGNYSSTWVSKQAGLGLLIKALSERTDEVKLTYEPV